MTDINMPRLPHRRIWTDSEHGSENHPSDKTIYGTHIDRIFFKGAGMSFFCCAKRRREVWETAGYRG